MKAVATLTFVTAVMAQSDYKYYSSLFADASGTGSAVFSNVSDLLCGRKRIPMTDIGGSVLSVCQEAPTAQLVPTWDALQLQPPRQSPPRTRARPSMLLPPRLLRSPALSRPSPSRLLRPTLLPEKTVVVPLLPRLVAPAWYLSSATDSPRPLLAPCLP